MLSVSGFMSIKKKVNTRRAPNYILGMLCALSDTLIYQKRALSPRSLQSSKKINHTYKWLEHRQSWCPKGAIT